MRKTLEIFLCLLKYESESEYKDLEGIDESILIELKKNININSPYNIEDSKLHNNVEGKNEWLINRVNSFKKIIPESSKRKKFVDALFYDVTYDLEENFTEFKFKTYNYQHLEDSKKNKVIQDEIKKIFSDLYTRYFNQKNENSDGYEISNRLLFYKEFFETNSNLSVCPACLGELNMRTMQLDHYFPKSKFPVLSIHPSNIVPICSTCNTVAGNHENSGKGEKVPSSPTNSSDENAVGGISKVFFPYKSSAHKKILGKIEKDTTTGARDKKFKAQLINSSDKNLSKKLENHIDSFNLEYNWSSKIPNIHNIIFLMAKKHFNIVIKEIYNDQELNSIEIFKALEKNISTRKVRGFLYYSFVLNSEEIISSIPDLLLTSNYAMYLILNPAPLEAFALELIEDFKIKNEMKIPYFFNENLYK